MGRVSKRGHSKSKSKPSDGLPDVARLNISPVRHLFAVVMFAVLAVLLLGLASEVFAARPASGGFFVLLGLFSAYAALVVWRSKGTELILTPTELCSSSGQVLCSIDEIAAVERSVFAFKPSGGFLLRLKESRGRGWVPGVWWRLGKSIGVGGVTIAPQARAMADLISARLAQKL